MKRHSKERDGEFGLDARIPRRDFLNGVLVSAGAAWASTVAPTALCAEARPQWGGNSADAVAAGHLVRDGAYHETVAARDTGEVYDLVVVGGGLSGLAAAYFFDRDRKGRGRVLVLENHDRVGGNARRDEFRVKGRTLYAPQASIVHQDLPPAFSPPEAVGRLLRDVGVDFAAYAVAPEAAAVSVFRDSASGSAEPKWFPNVMAAPLSDPVRKEFLAFAGTLGPFYAAGDWRAGLARLDRFAFKDYVEREKGWSEALFRLLAPDLAAFFAYPDQVSTAAVYAQFGGGPRPLYYLPGGNSLVSRHLLKRLVPGAMTGDVLTGRIDARALDRARSPVRIRLGATAVRVEHEARPGGAVLVTYSSRGRLHRVRARGAIMAGGGYVTKRVVRDLPDDKRDAYARFCYAPMLQVNVALTNSRALDRAGLKLISTYPDGFGVVLYAYETAAAAGGEARRDPDRPNVVGLGVPLPFPGMPAAAQALRGRTEMLATPFRDYERRARAELVRLLGPSGFDPRRDVAAISISRWGHHGYAFPYPGIYTDGAVEIARRPHGRIAFAHTDLDRFSHLAGALGRGYDAVLSLQASD